MDTTFRGKILADAKRLTEIDRNEQYGCPVLNHAYVADGIEWYLSMIGYNSGSVKGKLTSEDAAMIMVIVKMARIAQKNGDAVDSFTDAAAYIAIAAECRRDLMEEMDVHDDDD